MPRSREFDEQEVLAKATRLFRQTGYTGTSVRDLESATGLTTGSLYNSFGGKSGLFERVLAYYNGTVVRGRMERHLPGLRAPRLEAEALFRSVFEGPEADGLGCLLTSASTEAQALSDVARSFLGAAVDFQRSAFLALMSGVPTLSATEQRHRSELLLAAYHGMLVMVKRGQKRKALRAMTDAIISVVFDQTDRKDHNK